MYETKGQGHDDICRKLSRIYRETCAEYFHLNYYSKPVTLHMKPLFKNGVVSVFLIGMQTFKSNQMFLPPGHFLSLLYVKYDEF